MDNDYPVVFTITQDTGGCRIYTNDSRVALCDRCITDVREDKLFAVMVMISTIINNEGLLNRQKILSKRSIRCTKTVNTKEDNL